MKLRTERLLLREFEDDDWAAMHAYQSDPRYLRYYAASERGEPDARALVRRFVDWQHERPRARFQLAIVLDGEMIGNVGVRRDAARPGVADTGFELAPRRWGCGYATEAARAMLAFGFRQLRLHRVGARCVADNVGSANVLRKLGMRQEARLREREFFKGRRWDVLLFGILRAEWERGAAEIGAS